VGVATVVAALSSAAFAVTGASTITTVAGRSQFPGFAGDGGPAKRALFGGLNEIAVDRRNGNLYIADTAGYRIRKVTAAGTISTYACNGKQGFSGDGGRAKAARCRPVGIMVDRLGNVFFTDSDDNRVRRIGLDGRITTVAGAGGMPGDSGDGGPARAARLSSPRGLAGDSQRNVYVADVENHRIRKVTPDGTITAFAGTLGGGFSGDGGPATSARLANPFDVAVDAAGNVYIADTANNRVRKVTPDGIISTIAGTGREGSSGDGGPALAARVTPLALVVGTQGELYIAESLRVRKLSPNGTITTVAGNGRPGFSGDGGPAARARMVGVTGVAVDARGNLYLADGENRRIRKVWNGRGRTG
jgi:sugar lactone lactonase YvrE